MSVFLTLLSGGLAGAALTIVTQRISEAFRIWRLSNSIDVSSQRTPRGFRLRVRNRGLRSIEQAIAYLLIRYDKDSDLVDGEELAFIGTHERVDPAEDRLCWSIACPNGRSVSIDIYPGEQQALDFIRFDPDKIVFPSEQGWEDRTNKMRARYFLARKQYKGTVAVVSKNTLRRTIDIEIDATNGRQELHLEMRKLPGPHTLMLPWYKTEG